VLNLRNKSEYWNETWHLAFQALWSNKLRAGLTMLGVIIGSGCIVLVVTVALAGKRYIIAQTEGVGSNLVYAGITHSINSSRLTLSDEISVGDMDSVASQARRLQSLPELPISR
jgi:putative ABC transport system permease protein